MNIFLIVGSVIEINREISMGFFGDKYAFLNIFKCIKFLKEVLHLVIYHLRNN